MCAHVRFSEKLPVVVVGTHYDMPSPLVERDQTKVPPLPVGFPLQVCPFANPVLVVQKFSKEYQVMVFETGKGMGMPPLHRTT